MAINYSPFGPAFVQQNRQNMEREKKTNRESINAIALGMRVLFSRKCKSPLCCFWIHMWLRCGSGQAASRRPKTNFVCIECIGPIVFSTSLFGLCPIESIVCALCVGNDDADQFVRCTAFASAEWEFNAREFILLLRLQSMVIVRPMKSSSINIITLKKVS